MIKAYCDGASRGNPGPSACSYTLYDEHDNELVANSYYLGEHTNNYAEYAGLIALLQSGMKNMDIYCDSKLVVMQVTGQWQVKHEDIKPMHTLAHALYIRGEHTLHHIKGHSGIRGNERADELCNITLNQVKEGTYVERT